MKDKDKISKIDKKNWQDYVNDPKDIYDKDAGIKNNVAQTRYKFDLHGLTFQEAKKKVGEVINYCSTKQFKEILLITGKGIHTKNEKNIFVSKDFSKLQYLIPEYINSDENLINKISEIKKADPSSGGDGALILKLKKL